MIITGASRGIGKGIALTLASHGANIAFSYSKSVDLANDLVSQITHLGVNCKAYKSNAANFEESQKLALAVGLAKKGYRITIQDGKEVMNQIKFIHRDLFNYAPKE